MPDYRALAAQYAQAAGVPTSIFLAQINQESGFNPNARSGAGAQGIAQIVPKWHPGVNPMDPNQALKFAATWDRQNFDKYHNWNDVLSVYNSGRPWQVGQGIGETRNYVTRILSAAKANPGTAPGSAISRMTAIKQAQGAGPIGPQPTDNVAARRTALMQNLVSQQNAYLAGATPQPAVQPQTGLIAPVQAPSPLQALLASQSSTLAQQRASLAAQFAPAPARSGKAGGSISAPQTGTGGPWKAGSPVSGLIRESGEHPTEGLAGYPARDYFAKAGSRADAPISGTVVKLSGHDPALGPIEGPHGPLGWSVYIKGTDGHTYYLTHMGSRSVKLGQTVKAGQPIGTVANYDKYGTPSHIHMGVH